MPRCQQTRKQRRKDGSLKTQDFLNIMGTQNMGYLRGSGDKYAAS